MYFFFYQDILQNESIQLDEDFRISLINDIVQVNISLLMKISVDYCP